MSHFDEIAGHYDESLPPHVVEHYLRKRVEFIRSHVPRGKILDVGCGTGALAERLAAEGYEVTGIDPSEGMLGVLRERAPSITAVHADGTDLPFEDDSFDLAYCVAVMHHVAEPCAVHKTLAEMVRVTRGGGRVLVWDHNPRNPYWRNLMARVPQDTGAERLIPKAEILDGLHAAGAEPLLATETGLVPDFTPARLLATMAAVERAFEATRGLRRFAAHNVVLARKPAD